MASERRVVLTGGGSGGHFYPLLAVAEALVDQTPKPTLYYTGPEPYSQEELDKHGITFIKIPSGKRTKYASLGNIFMPFKVVWGTIVAIGRLYKVYPDVVFSKGSYTSVPTILAATILRIPIIIHESDTKVGSANRLAMRFARYIGIAYDDVAAAFPAHKTALVGIPLRKAFLTTPENPLAALGLPTDRPLILVTGGSQGAQRINELLLNSLDELLPHYTVLHQTGADHEETVRTSAAALIQRHELLTHYFVRGTLTGAEMHLAQMGASLIISRAGSGTIYEIAAAGKPSLIIPIPEAISHDQRTNAFAYARSGAASVLEEGNLNDGLLFAEVTRIMSDQATYTQMATAAKGFAKADAAQALAGTIMGIAAEHK